MHLVCIRLLFCLVYLALAPRCDCDPLAGRFASLVSRDSTMFLWTDDRAAFLRRAQRVALVQELSRIASPAFSRDLAAVGSDLSMFLSADLLAAIPGIAARGSGELALSVEGYVLERGQISPDILVLVDVTGFEGLAERLSLLADQPDQPGLLRQAGPLLASLGFPFELNPDLPVRSYLHRGITIAQFETAGGRHMALAESGGVLYCARSSKRVEMALDRALRQSLGSLADSVRFQEAVRQAGPKPGSLFWYVDMRRLRDPRGVRLLAESVGRDLLVEALSAYDGIGLTVRGYGESFEFRAFLERAAGPRSRRHTLMRRNAPLLTPAMLPQSSVAAFSMRADSAQAGALLCSMNRLLGGVRSAEVLKEYFLGLVGERAASQIAARLDGEFTVALPQGVRAGEALPRLVFLMQTGDPIGLNRWLSSVAQQSSQAMFRQIDLGRDVYFLISLPGNGFLTELALTVEDGWLIASPKLVHLRWFVAKCRTQSAALDSGEAFLRPMDRLDFGFGQPVSGLAFGAGPDLAVGVGAWLSAGLRFHPLLKREPTLVRSIARLSRLLLDPDLEGSLRGLGVRCRSTPEGVLIEGVGP